MSKVPNHFPSIPSTRKLAIVGESPGSTEVALGKPFCGPAGRLLWALFKRFGVERETCFVGNLAQYQPPGNNFSLLDPIQLEEGLAQLRLDLQAFEPNLIVCLGNHPLYHAKGGEKLSVSKLRGSLFMGQSGGPMLGFKCLSTFHPAACLRQPSWVPLLHFDLKRACAESLDSTLDLPRRQIEVFTSVRDFHHFVQEAEGKLLTVDVEGYPRGAGITCIGFGTSPYTAYVLPLWHHPWTPEEELLLWDDLKTLLENPSIKKICHNSLYELFILAHTHNIVLRGLVGDTMLATWELYCELEKSLQFCASIYTKEPFYKDDRKTNDPLTLYTYNGKDCCVTYEVYEALKKELRATSLTHYEFNLSLLDPVAFMMLRGIKFDKAKAGQLAADTRAQISIHQAELEKLVGSPINPASPAQVATLLYEKLKLPKQFKKDPQTGIKRVTTDYEALLKLWKKFKNPELECLIKLRDQLKKIQYIQMPTDEDGRVRCSLNLVGTETGRMSSSASSTGSGCMPGCVEVFTPLGWKRIDKVVKSGSSILQWWPDGHLDFCGSPKPMQFKFDGKLVKFSGRFIKGCFTPEHRIPVLTATGIKIKRAVECIHSRSFKVPISGRLSGHILWHGKAPVELTVDEVRVLAMIQADGNIHKNHVRLSFLKQRKIKRCRKLLKAARAQFSERPNKGVYTRFGLSALSSKKYIDWFGGKKLWGPQLLEQPVNILRALFDELRFWDATIRGKSFMWFSRHHSNALWVQTLAHFLGFSATINRKRNNTVKGSYGYRKKKTWLSTVFIKPRNYVRCFPTKHISNRWFHGSVFCFQTQSGFFPIRAQGVVSITGNSNLQTIPDDLRGMFIADLGMTMFQADLKGADGWTVACHAAAQGDSTMLDDLRFGLKPAKLLTLAMRKGEHIFGLSRPELSELSKEVGGNEEWDYFCSKKIQHGSSYDMQEAMLRTQIFIESAGAVELSPSDAKKLQGLFYKRYPGIPRWKAWVKRQIEDKGYILSPSGNLRKFFGRRSDHGTFKQALAQEPQNNTGYVTNMALKRLWDLQCTGFPIELLLQVHDSLNGQFATSRQPEALEHIKNCFKNPIRIAGIEVTIPFELKIGPSWGQMEEV